MISSHYQIILSVKKIQNNKHFSPNHKSKIYLHRKITNRINHYQHNFNVPVVKIITKTHINQKHRIINQRIKVVNPLKIINSINSLHNINGNYLFILSKCINITNNNLKAINNHK